MNKANIEAAAKVVKRHAETVRRNLRIVAETREMLPKKEAELEEARQKADIRNDADLGRVSRLHVEVEMIRGMVQRHPDQLDPDNIKLGEAISALNDALDAASRAEGEEILEKLTKALAPYFGTEAPAAGGGTTNPARDAALEAPILLMLPSIHRHSFGESNSFSPTSEGRAQSLVDSAEVSLKAADGWLKAGGKFLKEWLS
jgi:hypothetical protein